MTTLAVDVSRNLELGSISEYAVIASDIIYKHAAVGLVAGTGHARPLVAGDRFVGFAEKQADNASGAAAAKNVRTQTSGRVQLAVTGALITDVGQPIYATDDDTFVFTPVASSFIGFVERFISSGVVIVSFDTARNRDPYGNRPRELLSAATKTLDAEDSGKIFWCTVTTVITLPAIAAGLGGVKLVCGGPFGTVQISADPAAADMILGPDITGADNKDLINTLATARRGDSVVLDLGDADGYVVTELVGTWAREA